MDKGETVNKKEFDKNFDDFCKRYGTDPKIIMNYFEAMELNDLMSLEIYSMLIFNDCSRELFSDMKHELRELVKDYKELKE